MAVVGKFALRGAIITTWYRHSLNETEHCGRKTVGTRDVVFALHRVCINCAYTFIRNADRCTSLVTRCTDLEITLFNCDSRTVRIQALRIPELRRQGLERSAHTKRRGFHINIHRIAALGSIVLNTTVLKRSTRTARCLHYGLAGEVLSV